VLYTLLAVVDSINEWSAETDGRGAQADSLDNVGSSAEAPIHQNFQSFKNLWASDNKGSQVKGSYLKNSTSNKESIACIDT
jgi:hypothetical protein